LTTYLAQGSATTSIDSADLHELVRQALDWLGPRQQVLTVVPDESGGTGCVGRIAAQLYQYYGSGLVGILPALGTHRPMTNYEIATLYPGVPSALFREHRWRDDLVLAGEVPQDFVSQVSDGTYHRSWPAELSRQIMGGQHDLIVSIGTVAPHEVLGMGSYNENLFIGTGGRQSIDEARLLGAVYGLERILGRAETPLRKIFNYAQDHFCPHLPLLSILPVMDWMSGDTPILRGLFIGDDHDCFWQASRLSRQINVREFAEGLPRIIVNLPAESYPTLWRGNRAIYRTRMALAADGHLVVLAPGVHAFGKEPHTDQLIRRFGYRDRDTVLEWVDQFPELQANLSVAAHLILGSTGNRFRITYCPGHLTPQEVRSVGYDYGDESQWRADLPADLPTCGWIKFRGEDWYYIDNPTRGLWSTVQRIND